MMNYVGKTCPYCKTEFEEGADIVVCSLCEMPHHKECWIENKACTTFGCTGTMMGTGDEAGKEINGLTCDKCGQPYSNGQKFCASCGNLLDGKNAPNFAVAGANSQYSGTQANYGGQINYNSNSQGYQYNAGYNSQIQADPDLMAFLQSNQPTYLEKLNKMSLSNTKTSWNWCSFLFGGNWFAYRKMYGIAAAYIGISFILALTPTLGAILNLALWICSGIFGNYLYKQYIDSELQVAKSMDQYNKAAYISKKGGTSIVGLIVAIVVSIIVWIIITSL